MTSQTNARTNHFDNMMQAIMHQNQNLQHFQRDTHINSIRNRPLNHVFRLAFYSLVSFPCIRARFFFFLQVFSTVVSCFILCFVSTHVRTEHTKKKEGRSSSKHENMLSVRICTMLFIFAVLWPLERLHTVHSWNENEKERNTQCTCTKSTNQIEMHKTR